MWDPDNVSFVRAVIAKILRVFGLLQELGDIPLPGSLVISGKGISCCIGARRDIDPGTARSQCADFHAGLAGEAFLLKP